MFDEPIKVGLIRFADAYDHYFHRAQAADDQLDGAGAPSRGGPPGGRKPAREDDPVRLASGETADEEGRRQQRQQARAVRDFDLSHQPLLVIYTRAAR